MGPKERQILITVVLCSCLLGFLIVYFLVYLYRAQRKSAQYSEEKNNVIIAVSEMERNDIAIELHNDITPYLASVKMRIEMLQPENEDSIAKCVQVLGDCIDRIRVMSKQLSPIGIAEQSFWDALEQFIHKTGVDLVLRIDLILLDKPTLRFEQHNQIYRILQEIILNSVKHSRAQRMKIEISIEEDFLLIRTVDDGMGFDETEVTLNQKHGLGLLNMQSRINYLGGNIVKSDKAISGTQYNIRIPLQYDYK